MVTGPGAFLELTTIEVGGTGYLATAFTSSEELSAYAATYTIPQTAPTTAYSEFKALNSQASALFADDANTWDASLLTHGANARFHVSTHSVVARARRVFVCAHAPLPRAPSDGCRASCS